MWCCFQLISLTDDEILSITCDLTWLEKDFRSQCIDLKSNEMPEWVTQPFPVDINYFHSMLHFKRSLLICKRMMNSKSYIKCVWIHSDMATETRFRKVYCIEEHCQSVAYCFSNVLSRRNRNLWRCSATKDKNGVDIAECRDLTLKLRDYAPDINAIAGKRKVHISLAVPGVKSMLFFVIFFGNDIRLRHTRCCINRSNFRHQTVEDNERHVVVFWQTDIFS